MPHLVSGINFLVFSANLIPVRLWPPCSCSIPCQLTILTIHNSLSLSRPAQDLPLTQILPTIDSLPGLRTDSTALWLDRFFWASRFLANVTFAIMLSPVRLSSVGNGRAPYSGGWNFRQYFYGFGILAIHWHSLKISRRTSQGNPSAGGIKHKRGSQI